MTRITIKFWNIKSKIKIKMLQIKFCEGMSQYTPFWFKKTFYSIIYHSRKVQNLICVPLGLLFTWWTNDVALKEESFFVIIFQWEICVMHQNDNEHLNQSCFSSTKTYLCNSKTLNYYFLFKAYSSHIFTKTIHTKS